MLILNLMQMTVLNKHTFLAEDSFASAVNDIIESHAMLYFVLSLVVIVFIIIIAIFYGVKKSRNSYQIKYLYTHDDLTEVYNQRKLCNLIDKKVNNENAKNICVLILGIKKFKLINENFTNSEGDNLLKFIAQELILIGKEHPNYLYGRVKEEKFAIVSFDDENMAFIIEERLKSAIDKYDASYKIHLNFGVYKSEETLVSRSMIDRALLALGHSSDKFGHTFGFYDNNLIDSLKSEESISNTMADALKNNEFNVYLQPKFDLISKEVVGAESLVRWIKPNGRMIFPNDFIPVFEGNGFITKLDYYMIEKTCIILKRWLETGFKVVPISVNISRVDLFDKKLFEKIVNLVEKYNIPPRLLELEFTESVYFENEKEMVSVMVRLQNYGFRILMDDFGSGYSSFNMLSEYDVDVIKIDMRFLQKDNNKIKMHKIIKSIVHMASLLELDVTVEGVETEEQVLFLKNIGCNKGQGYYFSKPVPINDFEKIVDDQSLNSEFMSKLAKDIEEDEKNPLDITAEDIWALDIPIYKLFNNAVNGFAICDRFENNKGLKIIRVNQTYYDIVKIPKGKSVYPGNIVDLIYSEDKVEFEKAIDKCFNEHKVVVATFRRKLVTGEIRWLQGTYQPVGLIKEMQLLCVELVDITEKKSLEKEYNYILKEQKVDFIKLNVKTFEIEKISGPLKDKLGLTNIFDISLSELVNEANHNDLMKILTNYNETGNNTLNLVLRNGDYIYEGRGTVVYFEGINREHYFIGLYEN